MSAFRSIPGTVACRAIYAFSSMYCNLPKGCFLVFSYSIFLPYYGSHRQRCMMGFETLGGGSVFSPEVVNCSIGPVNKFQPRLNSIAPSVSMSD
ncbi:hypothetical protein CDAR_219511 [Caerostris darwini]|uniref:Uncharacterized protein n=1 Tax=Caerostris darwini TaxID=1538125 RepID=A0AAV4TF01_9ARAC|nr:hypothetical protein CDAR_219511 [Caerostris darwini]